jgi:hypothetical protein
MSLGRSGFPRARDETADTPEVLISSRGVPGREPSLFTPFAESNSCTGMKRSMELRHVFLVTFVAAVGGIGGMPDR